MTKPNPLPELGPLIAACIPGWKFYAHQHDEYKDCYTFFLIPDDTIPQPSRLPYTWIGKAIHLSADTYHNKLKIFGYWPYTKNGQEFRPCNVWENGEHLECDGIGCSLDKDPKKIAADILRRFLPKYEETYPKCVASMEQDLAARDIQGQVVQEIGNLVNGKPNKNQVRFSCDDLYGHVDVNHGGKTGTMEIRGSIALIKVALEAIKANGGHVSGEPQPYLILELRTFF
jgi:hypothetical protein